MSAEDLPRPAPSCCGVGRLALGWGLLPGVRVPGPGVAVGRAGSGWRGCAPVSRFPDGRRGPAPDREVPGGGGRGLPRPRGMEVSSVLEYSSAGLLPIGFDHPRVSFDQGNAILSLRAALADLPAFPELSGIMEVLPDTVPLELRGRLEAFEGGTALRVESIEAARIPLPRRMFPTILQASGGGTRRGSRRKRWSCLCLVVCVRSTSPAIDWCSGGVADPPRPPSPPLSSRRSSDRAPWRRSSS
jgi:hypothetical protein